MATTKITSNVLALSAAQTNINNDGSFTLSVPTQINNTVALNGAISINTTSYTYGTGSAASHRTALGLDTLFAAKANLAGGNTFTGAQTISGASVTLQNAGAVAFSINDTSYANIPTFNLQQIGTTRGRIEGGVGLTSRLDFSVGNPLSRSMSLNQGGTQNYGVTIGRSSVAANVAPPTDGLHVQGNVGIGTATPNEKLTVVGNISATGNLTVDTNTLFVDSTNNRVGIGTNNPQQAIDFRPVTFEANQSGGIRFDNTAGQWPCGIYIRSDGVGGPRLSLDAPFQTNTLNLYSNNVGIGTTTPNEKLTVVGNISATGNLTVDTNTFFVDSVNNRVGIGVSPLSSIVGKLDVTGSPATTTPSDVLVLSRPFNAGIGFPSIVSFKLANPNTSINNTRLDIALMQANSSTPRSPDTTVMTLMGDGNVGIGTTTPNEKLTVVGNISATGDLTASRPSGNSVSLSIQQGSINTWALSSVASSTALDVTSTTGSKMRLYENGDAAFGVLPGQNLLELKAGTALEIKFPFYSSYAFAGNINFSDYSSIGSLRSGAGFYMGTGVKTANSNGNSLLKTSVSSSQAHFFYTRYDRGLEFHSGITGNQNDIIADTTNLRSRISPEGVFYIGSNSNGTGFPAQLKIETLWTNVPAFQTKLITSQTSDHYRWTDSSNNVQGVINNLGSVGIGTATPNEKLTVVGNISATGIVTAEGNKLAAETFAIAMAIAIG